jgi:hypothetical protein
VVAKLFIAGNQVPVIAVAFVEKVGNGASVAPEQIAATCVNVGITIGFTVIVIVAVVVHTPAVGVNV